MMCMYNILQETPTFDRVSGLGHRLSWPFLVQDCGVQEKGCTCRKRNRTRFNPAKKKPKEFRLSYVWPMRFVQVEHNSVREGERVCNRRIYHMLIPPLCTEPGSRVGDQ